MKQQRNYLWSLAALAVFGPLSAIAQDVVLTIDLATNATTLSNADVVTNVQFDAYRIQSPLGLFSTTGWSSLQDQFIADWNEFGTAAPTMLGETKSTGADLLVSGTTLNLGMAYDPAAATVTAGFGADILGDPSVEVYNSATQTVTTGRIEYIGEPQYNNLVVTVDTNTGSVILENESPSSVSIDAYAIFSTGAALSTGWNGVRDTDATWNEIGTVSATQLGETNPTTAITLNAGDMFDLGSAFTVGGAQDLTFDFHITGAGQATNGFVKYVTASTLACDLDSDGDCDPTDINLLYASGTTPAGVSAWLSQASAVGNPYKADPADMYVLGDASLDGDVDSIDLGLLLNNFNSTSGVGWGGGDMNADGNVDSVDLGQLLNNFNFTSAVSAAAVPEPQAWSLLLVAAVAFASGLRSKNN